MRPHARPNVIKARGNQPAPVAGHRRRHLAHHGPVDAEHRRTGKPRADFGVARSQRRSAGNSCKKSVPTPSGTASGSFAASGAERLANLVLVFRHTTDGTTRPRLHLQQRSLTEPIGRVGLSRAGPMAQVDKIQPRCLVAGVAFELPRALRTPIIMSASSAAVRNRRLELARIGTSSGVFTPAQPPTLTADLCRTRCPTVAEQDRGFASRPGARAGYELRVSDNVKASRQGGRLDCLPPFAGLVAGVHPTGQTGTAMNETRSPDRSSERIDVHNTNVNEAAAAAGRCGMVHLPTGRMCRLRSLHEGACQLAFPDPAIPALPGARGQARVGAPRARLAAPQ